MLLSHLSEVSDVEQVEGLEQLAPPHAEHVAACCQERSDILQAQELLEDREDRL